MDGRIARPNIYAGRGVIEFYIFQDQLSPEYSKEGFIAATRVGATGESGAEGLRCVCVLLRTVIGIFLAVIVFGGIVLCRKVL